MSKWEKAFYIFWGVGTAVTIIAGACNTEPNRWEFEDDPEWQAKFGESA